MTMRCCGEMRGVSQPDERVALAACSLLMRSGGRGLCEGLDLESRRVGEEEWEGVLLSAME